MLTTMVRSFERFGLKKNLGKTKTMICTPGFILGQQRAEAYNRRATWEGTTLLERTRTRVSCKVCGGSMDACSLQNHTEIAHGRVLKQVRSMNLG